MRALDELLQLGSQLEQRSRALHAGAADAADVLSATEAAAETEARAHAAYRAAIRLLPSDPAAYYNLGHALRAHGPGRSAESLWLFHRAARLEPSSPASVTSLAYFLLATPGSDDSADKQRRRGLAVLADGVQRGLWPRSTTAWQ
eukprot:SAG11_NODE_14823_length_598_cov_1.238477_1_plen_144_part_10